MCFQVKERNFIPEIVIQVRLMSSSFHFLFFGQNDLKTKESVVILIVLKKIHFTQKKSDKMRISIFYRKINKQDSKCFRFLVSLAWNGMNRTLNGPGQQFLLQNFFTST